MKKWKVSCPLKVILLGEHSVLYKKRAITMAINLHLKAAIELSPTTKIVFNEETFFEGPRKNNLVDLNIEFSKKEDHGNVVTSGILQVIQSLNIGCSIIINSEIPLGCGLGTSAAASICVALGCLTASNFSNNLGMNELEIFERSYEIAQKLDYFIHGKSSGVDVLTCFKGGILYYDNRSNSKLLNCKPIKLNLPELHIIYSKIPKDTSKMVERVAVQYEKYPQTIDSIMHTIDGLISHCLENGLENPTIFYCQKMLSSLNVSHPKLDCGLRLLEKHSLFGKITGAGGGGCLISFGTMSNELRQDLILNDFQVYNICESPKGVQIIQEL
eukprot:NODE_460_length_7198_cov_0.858290.p3 type:complete len:329 gc:universal NODE_460_length_7198_cov_0.858290:2587-3573(+)